MINPKPIKRSAAIVELSKDHHFALLLVWKIRKGLANSIEFSRITNYVIHFFETDLIPHFKAEEEFLFSKISNENTLRMQAEEEHRIIYGMIDALRRNPGDKDALEQFAKTLESHIRFEERKLFNFLQENISESDLSEIAISLNSRKHDNVTVWNDIFWEKEIPKA